MDLTLERVRQDDVNRRRFLDDGQYSGTRVSKSLASRTYRMHTYMGQGRRRTGAVYNFGFYGTVQNTYDKNLCDSLKKEYHF